MEFSVPVEVKLHTKMEQAGDEEETRLSLCGTLYQKKGTMYLRYKEVINDTDTVKTTIKIRDEDTTIIRHGAVLMRQRFVLDTRIEGMYESNFGRLKIAAFTESMGFHWNDQEKRGTLLLYYRVLFEGQETSYHQLSIKLKGEEE